MQYPYNDDNMIFNYVTHRYVLTEKGVRAYAAVSLGESFKSDVANSITAFLNLASQQTYNIIHSYNVNTEVQDYIIATTKSGREMIQEAMINRLLFLLTERKIFDEAFYSVITRILPEINTSICYSGQVFRLDKPIRWEELSGEEESENVKTIRVKTQHEIIINGATISGGVSPIFNVESVNFVFTNGTPQYENMNECGAALYAMGYNDVNHFLPATGTITLASDNNTKYAVEGVRGAYSSGSFRLLLKSGYSSIVTISTDPTVTTFTDNASEVPVEE